MNENPPSHPKSLRGYATGLTVGLGAGLLLETVLYRYFPVADLTDPLRIVGFALLFGGIVLSYRRPSKANDP